MEGMNRDISKTRKLIDCVRKRRELWDKNFNGYKNRHWGEKAWKAISEETGIPIETCKERWLKLRNTYREQLKKIRSGKPSTWPYLEFLEFLKSHITFCTPIEKESSQSQDKEEEDMEAPKTEDDKDGLKETSLEEDGRKSMESTTVTTTQQGLGSEEIDEDYHFVMAILPRLRALPQNRKATVMMKILEILCK